MEVWHSSWQGSWVGSQITTLRTKINHSGVARFVDAWIVTSEKCNGGREEGWFGSLVGVDGKVWWNRRTTEVVASCRNWVAENGQKGLAGV